MKKTILLVEDSRFQKAAIERILFRAGHLVLLAGDGEEALRLARESRPDLILLDLRLPRMEGEEVLYLLKQDPGTLNIPVIIVSDLAEEDKVELKAAGAADCFQKSWLLNAEDGEDTFLAVIQRVLRDADRLHGTTSVNVQAHLARRHGV